MFGRIGIFLGLMQTFRAEENLATFIIWKSKTKEKAAKKVKAPVNKKEEKKEQKITQDSPIKKLFLGKKKSVKTEEPVKVALPKEENISVSQVFQNTM